MDENQKSQIANLALIAVLFSITLLFSTSYFYLLLNLLIIISLLGTQSGILSYKTQMDNSKPVLITQIVEESSPEKLGHDKTTTNILPQDTHDQKAVDMVKVSSKPAEKQNSSMNKRCPSHPSLFFIGGNSTEEAEVEESVVVVEEEEEEEIGGLSGEELFDKAEMFIGNFYNQLKMQREESWKGIHHDNFYQKAF